MAIQLQLRKGTKIQNDAFTGAEGELTYDSTTKTVRVHDGATQGGVGFVDLVVDFQAPTAENNYTWYRKYKSGWVEQGGFIARNAAEQNTVTFSIPMANTNYSVSVTGDWTGKLDSAPVANKASATTTGISLTKDGSGMGLWWQVIGMAAE